MGGAQILFNKERLPDRPSASVGQRFATPNDPSPRLARTQQAGRRGDDFERRAPDSAVDPDAQRAQPQQAGERIPVLRPGAEAIAPAAHECPGVEIHRYGNGRIDTAHAAPEGALRTA